jgi:endonuclease I
MIIKMKRRLVFLFAILAAVLSFGQQTGYYNGTSGKDGDDLKTALYDIIKGHTAYSYYYSKFIFQLSDADPGNPDNVIQVYTGFSHDNSDYGNSGLQLNREHVWAKSHGNFDDIPIMNGDVHNLKPSAATVNQDKSNLDFDNGGEQHDIATNCYYTDSTWEARDAVKGDIARIIFYMSTRYEGENGELDLEVVDWNNTFPYPQHGKLSTLLEWNLMDPPDAFERNRNDVIFSYQKNRNPFIDNPEFAQLIWGGETVGSLSIDNLQITPEIVVAQQPVQISATVINESKMLATATLKWGLSFESLNNEISMTSIGDVFTADIPGQAENATVYYQIFAEDGQEETSTVVYNYYVPKIFTGTLVPIYDIQGQQADSPYDGQVVSTSGVVTANFGTSYFIQDGFGDWNGMFIYESGRNPSIGDSIILTGEVSEYYNKTEISNISDYYFISANNTLPEPLLVQTGNVQEAHESVLVKVNNAICTDENYQANYFMWEVDDGSGPLKIHNTSVFEYEPSEGSYYNVTGPMNYDFDEWKIEIRFESDVTGGGDFDGPTVVEVTPIIYYNIKVLFNEPVDETTAEDLANYSLSNNGNILSIVQHSINKSQVNLTVDPLYGDYDLTVQNIEDVAGNVMEPQTISFSYLNILEQVFDGNISIYPNPASEYFMIDISPLNQLDKELILTINNVSGQEIMSQSFNLQKGSNSYKINTSSLDKGLYFVKIYCAGKSGVQKLIIK